MILLFWCLVGLVVYTYAGYPVVAGLTGRVLNRRVHREPTFPTLSVVIAAFDEGHTIEARIRNVLGSIYPKDRLEVIVASDGSTDDTVARAAGVASPRVSVLDLPRRGKAAALQEGVAHATGDVLVFTDANTSFRPDALAMLVSNFADTDVGGVAGNTGYRVERAGESSGLGEALYWKYDSWLKQVETRCGSMVSAHGGMYAVRRELFRPVEDRSVTDDFAISTAVVDQGARLVFEPDAIGHERTMADGGSEFRRRVRLMTRGIRGVILRRRLLNPFRHGFYSVSLGSRKVLRRLLPATFPLLFVASVALAGTSIVYAAAAWAQALVLGVATLGWALRRTGLGRSPLLYVPFYFCLANLASLVALAKVAGGRRIERWTPHRHVQSHGSTPEGGLQHVRAG